ncbi:unnamed protein product [Arabidopsis lyrata]|uniref:RBR-type E3 ubiquitin transferase n=1 Tax=Arabidopsis lyrata subsp. lyrata TaxID=81972 RepID=D7LMN4_ARALL|nr:hypothetical protein ARALYDRAFT_905714 [Arabidopsis lyrata subsp. lyrata]CAH8267529.1 unnamed protein product [Arabidopsis lyrata]
MQHIRQRFASIFPSLVPVNPPHQAKATCNICLDDDVNANQMFSVDRCHHRFCYECVKQHIEMWQQRIKEDSIPGTKRIYCPNPRCSALISVNKLCKSTKEAQVRKNCYKCGELFCINCKVPWHSNLSCNDYKRLGPNPTTDDLKFQALANQNLWRQCRNCRYMIDELSEGCISVTCRCGQNFCYQCGAKAGGCHHGHVVPPRARLPPHPPSPPPTSAPASARDGA